LLSQFPVGGTATASIAIARACEDAPLTRRSISVPAARERFPENKVAADAKRSVSATMPTDERERRRRQEEALGFRTPSRHRTVSAGSLRARLETAAGLRVAVTGCRHWRPRRQQGAELPAIWAWISGKSRYISRRPIRAASMPSDVPTVQAATCSLLRRAQTRSQVVDRQLGHALDHYAC
jgi:hypothetical protein